MRLAKLITDANGITDIHRQATYTSGLLVRVKGDLPIEALYGDRADLSRPEKYESVCIRITGGFDD